MGFLTNLFRGGGGGAAGTSGITPISSDSGASTDFMGGGVNFGNTKNAWVTPVAIAVGAVALAFILRK